MEPGPTVTTRLAELVPVFGAMVNSPTLRGVGSSLFSALATAAALAGDRLTAAGVLATLCGRDLAELPRSSSWLPAMFGIAETACLLGDAALSARVYELLTPYADQLAAAGQEAATLGIALPQYPDGGPIEQDPATCERTGQHWIVRYRRRSAPVPHSAGMPYLAVLLANLGRDVPAVDLATGSNVLGSAALSGQPVLDRAAIQRYCERIEELRARIEDPGPDERPARTTKAIVERDWLLAELASAAGIAGRTRKFNDGHERARLAVGKAIRRAIVTVEKSGAVVGAHLRDCVRTGMRCSYRPD